MEISAGLTAARLTELELGLALLDAGLLVPFPALLTVRERRAINICTFDVHKIEKRGKKGIRR